MTQNSSIYSYQFLPFLEGIIANRDKKQMKFTCKESSRLDNFLAKELDLPRNQVTNLIKNIGVHVNKKLVKKAGFKVSCNDGIEAYFPEPKTSPSHYEVSFEVDILYEDEHLLVLNKPPFVTVHGAPSVKEATLVDWLKLKNISLSTLSGEERHGLVHRIDKQTSGALAVAKTNEAHLGLSRQLEEKTMGRYYLAMVHLPLKENCIVEKPIGRNPKNRLKMGIVQHGRSAKSAFFKIQESSKSRFELIAAKLYTGRTHQIRVHLESISRAILGDDLYGFKSQKAKISRVMLHAHMLYLTHPITKQALLVKAPLFEDFNELLKKYFERQTYEETIDALDYLDMFSLADEWVLKHT